MKKSKDVTSKEIQDRAQEAIDILLDFGYSAIDIGLILEAARLYLEIRTIVKLVSKNIK